MIYHTTTSHAVFVTLFLDT